MPFRIKHRPNISRYTASANIKKCIQSEEYFKITRTQRQNYQLLTTDNIKMADIISLYGSTALSGLGRFFCFSVHTQDSWDGRSSRRKAATFTQNNTNTE
jgi:hypothetical protein